MRSGWVRVVQTLLGLSIVLFAIRALARNWDQLRAQPLEWQFRPGWVVLSLIVTWLMYALLILAWRGILSLQADSDRLAMARLVGESWRARLAPDHVAEVCEGWYRDALAR